MATIANHLLVEIMTLEEMQSELDQAKDTYDLASARKDREPSLYNRLLAYKALKFWRLLLRVVKLFYPPTKIEYIH
jgi:hypothetical protein